MHAGGLEHADDLEYESSYGFGNNDSEDLDMYPIID
jgi:hypothetical protein